MCGRQSCCKGERHNSEPVRNVGTEILSVLDVRVQAVVQIIRSMISIWGYALHATDNLRSREW